MDAFLLFDEFLQSDSIHEFHGEVMRSFGFACIEGTDNIRMGESANELHFPLETPDGLRIVEQCLRQDFDRHRLLQQFVLGFIDGSHTAASEFAKNVVIANLSYRVKTTKK